jgi:predicted Zn-dependent peptidase
MISALLQNELQSDHAAISVVGDFNSKEMKATLTVLFSKWKKSVKRKKILLNDCHPQSRVLLVNKEDARNHFLYRCARVSRNNPDYVAIEVVNTLFGGRFTSMLNDELRVNSGLTYGASSRFNALKMEVHLQSARSQPKKLPSQLSIKP